MSNATTTSAESVLPASPDVAVLQQMRDPIVFVSRTYDGVGARKITPESVVRGAINMSVKGILDLQNQLMSMPNGGPGTYRFDVTDQETQVKTSWQIRLTANSVVAGATASGAPSAGMPVSSPTAVGTPAFSPVALPAAPSPDVVSWGNGVCYDPRHKIITTPDGHVHYWDGGPLPEALQPGNRAAMPTQVAALAPSIGTSPEVLELRRKLDTYEVMLQEQRERSRQEEERRREENHRREIEGLRDSQNRALVDMQTRFETLVAKLTEKPAVDPQVLELQRRLEERERSETMRSEFTTKLESVTGALREAMANKSDPMIGMLTTMLSQQSASAAENLRTLREASGSQLAAAQQVALTPERLLGLLEHLKEAGSSPVNEKLMGVMNSLFDQVIRFRRVESELAGEQHGTDWVGVFRELADKAGGAIQQVAQYKAREASAVAAQANLAAVQTQTRFAQPTPRQGRPGAVPAQPVAASAAEPAAVLPAGDSEALRDALAAQMGYDKPAAARPMPAAPAPAPITPDAILPGRPAAAIRSPLMRVRQPSQQAAVPVPPPTTTLEELHKIFDATPDPEFFGPFVDAVNDLRAELSKPDCTYTEDDVAQFVMDARPYIAQAAQQTGKIPMAVEAFAKGGEWLDYLIDRLLPGGEDAYLDGVTTALKAKIAAEVG